MSSPALEQKKKLASEVLFRQLISTEKCEENAVEFLRMELKKRRANLKEFRKIADYYGEEIATEVERINHSLTEAEKERITKQSLEKAFDKWRKENGG